jgi:outer membrane protein assembly factor BamB
VKRAPFLALIALTLYAQGWQQWGQNSRHTGAVPVAAQMPVQVLDKFNYDRLADQMRQDADGDLLVHYMAPLVDGDDVFVMSRGDSNWISCQSGQAPCGPQEWGRMEWGVTKLRNNGGKLEKLWTAMSSWKPAPDNGSGWEPVFHPALSGGYVYLPGEAGMLMKIDRQTGQLIDCLQPFEENDPSRFVTSPLTVDTDGSVYYTVMKLDTLQPWTKDVEEAFLVKVDAAGRSHKVSFAELVPKAAAGGCATSAPCGSQRPGLNAAPAIAPDGTVYVISRAHFNSAYGYVVAVNADLTPKWSASLLGGVDPATNEMPAGSVLDQSTASPAIAPDGTVLYGAAEPYNVGRGHLFRFSSAGDFLSSYDFGWDITPAIYEHDGTWSVIIKDNFYCNPLDSCGQGEPRYGITSLGPDLRPEWTYLNTNDQACERLADGTLKCETSPGGFEWCVNMVAVDRNGVVFANSEDGNVYAIDRSGKEIGRVFLKVAIGAAYTPLAIGGDGRVYTQNDGTLFVVGEQ